MLCSAITVWLAAYHQGSWGSMDMNDTTAIAFAQRRRVGCILLVTALLLVLSASCALGSVGIRAGLIQPPVVQRHLGPVYLFARTTRTPTCAALQCPEYLYLNPAAGRQRYAVWVIVVWPRTTSRPISTYHLAQIPLERP